MNKQTANLLEQHFDTAFAAPDGIKKLRELILTLAMQGKLVEQDPNDPPASELLKEIEKEKSAHEGLKIPRKPESLRQITAEDMPYELPRSWAWVRFGDIAQHNSGKTLDKGRNTGQPRDYITTSNLYWGKFELDNVRKMLIREDELDRCTARKNDLLICEGGESGRAAVWHFDTEVCFQNHVHRARFYKDINPYFAYRFFEKLNATGEINKHRKGVGISNMSSKALSAIVFPLPPLSEQHRIVARINQLMARCEELEKLRNQREEKRLAVHAAAIRQLLDAPDGSAWDFIQQHFNELYSVKENVAELRKAILQLAVMGRLVPQDPNDPPASELLKEIEKEKALHEGTKSRRKGEKLPPIKPEEVPYDLPKGWICVRLGMVAEVNGGFAFKSSKYSDDGVRVIRISDFDEKGFKDDKVVRYPYSNELGGFSLEINNILMAMTGGTVGKSLLVKSLTEPMVVNQRVATIKMAMGIMPEFINGLIRTKLIQSVIHAAKNSTNDNISMADITGFIVPLPPIPEQHRIVARINQLMAMCDTLEQQIDAATSKNSELLNALTAHL
ncbi:MAG: restriction endonuclease subunit S [Chlorobium limicola]|nr:restriction endonuclease subunit S [Chlorobium limicola]